MPIDYHIFHQNMMTFSPHSGPRVSAFTFALKSVSGVLGDYRRVIVAGFTEIMASETTGLLCPMMEVLDPWLQQPVYFGCGHTGASLQAVYVPSEYVAISVATVVTDVDRGRVLLTNTNQDNGRKWNCFRESDLSLSILPTGYVPDSRGLCYIVCTVEGRKMCVGFIHNMYGLGDRSGAYQSIPTMKAAIWAKHGLASTVPFIIGGDFNVEPRDISRRSDLKAMAKRGRGSAPIPTTEHNAYDFFVTNSPIDETEVRIFRHTRNKKAKLSDHAAISAPSPIQPSISP